MNKFIGAISLVFAFTLPAQATAGDKPQDVKAESSQTTHTVGDSVREVGRDVKSAAHKVRKAVFTRCGDGRHTVKGASGCKGHGGVSATN